MERSFFSVIFMVLGVIGGVFAQLEQSVLEKRQADLLSPPPSMVSPPPPLPPPLKTLPPPHFVPPPPSTKLVRGSKKNITGKSLYSHHNHHPGRPDNRHHSNKKAKDRKINIGKKIGLFFVVIAGILQVAVVGFLLFMRWDLSRIKDRYDGCSS